MKNLPFDTLILSNKAKDRWYPTPIDTLRKSIKIDTDIENATALHNNIAYNLQYIEFFGKFYEDGGRHFEPASPDLTYTDVYVEQNN